MDGRAPPRQEPACDDQGMTRSLTRSRGQANRLPAWIAGRAVLSAAQGPLLRLEILSRPDGKGKTWGFAGQLHHHRGLACCKLDAVRRPYERKVVRCKHQPQAGPRRRVSSLWQVLTTQIPGALRKGAIIAVAAFIAIDG